MGLFNDIIKRLADSYHPIGSIYITNSSTNPSSFLGGTWTCIKKSFKEATITNSVTYNSTNTTNGSQYLYRHGESIFLRLNFKTLVTVADTAIEIGTFSTANAGLNNFYTPSGLISQSDGSNAIAMIGLGASIQFQDVITKTTATSVAANADWWRISTQISFINPDWMVDSACEQFYWKRTA